MQDQKSQISRQRFFLKGSYFWVVTVQLMHQETLTNWTLYYKLSATLFISRKSNEYFIDQRCFNCITRYCDNCQIVALLFSSSQVESCKILQQPLPNLSKGNLCHDPRITGQASSKSCFSLHFLIRGGIMQNLVAASVKGPFVITH